MGRFAQRYLLPALVLGVLLGLTLRSCMPQAQYLDDLKLALVEARAEDILRAEADLAAAVREWATAAGWTCDGRFCVTPAACRSMTEDAWCKTGKH